MTEENKASFWPLIFEELLCLFLKRCLTFMQDEKSSGDWLHNNENIISTTELYT